MPQALAFLGAHEVIAVQSAFHRLVVLAGMLDVDLVQPALGLDDVLGVALDVRDLALKAARGLVQT